MERIFRAKKMLDRIHREGMDHMLREEDIELINFLDGKTGNDYNWESFVHNRPLVWIPEEEGFDGAYVALVDCD